MKRIRVLIVEDSAVVREHLRRIVSRDPRFEVVGLAASGEEAIDVVERLAPDVITMDIHLPGIQGFDATREIMARRPTPIVIVSAVDMPTVQLTMEALRAGALSAVEKPVAASDATFETIAARLCTQLAIMSEVRVVRQRSMVTASAAPKVYDCAKRPTEGYRVLAVAASTGGPNALAQLMKSLGPQFRMPVAVVQHITPGFVSGFADWLSNTTGWRVRVVDGRAALQAGELYLANTESHLTVESDSVKTVVAPPVGGHRPSANVLFSSAARNFGPSAMGVLLTGMGDDGAAGLREMRQAGAFTMAESEATAVVYGMPAAAVQAGAVCESHALPDIGKRILEVAGEA